MIRPSYYWPEHTHSWLIRPQTLSLLRLRLTNGRSLSARLPRWGYPAGGWRSLSALIL